jgi:Tfp pilus assembly protein PilX
MKNLILYKSRRRGGALLVAMILCGILCVSVAGYLSLIQQQNRASARSQCWNTAMAVVEAGVEEGLQELNSGMQNPGSDGWSYDGTVYTCTRTLAGASQYTVTVDLTSNPGVPTIVARGTVNLPMLACNAPPGFLAAIGTTPSTDTATVSRAVRVRCGKSGILLKAMVAKSTIDLNGNNITTDSFDSSDPNYSTAGQYDPTKTKDNGDIASNATITNSISVGNANIYGHAATGPQGTVAIGPNGGIGGHSWQATHKGVEPGVPPWVTHDANFTFPDTSLPSTAGCLTPVGGLAVTSSSQMVTTTTCPAPGTYSGSISTNTVAWGKSAGTYYTYIAVVYSTNYYDHILSSSTTKYSLNSLSGSTLVLGDSTTLILPSGFSMSGNDKFTIANGGSVTVYAGGTSCAIGGNGVINQPGLAAKFILYCAPSVTTFSLSGNGSFIGILVGPNINISMNGGGNNTIDFIGALVVNSVTMNGHFNFHYDEALKNLSGNGRYLVKSWDEIAPQ